MPVDAPFLDRHPLLKEVGHLVVRVPVEVALEHLAHLHPEELRPVAADVADDQTSAK